MKHKYHYDILEILAPAGLTGMPVRLIALQVYNRHVGLFITNLSFERVYQLVRWYLWYHSKRACSPFSRAPKRGHYALKKDALLQTMINFSPTEEVVVAPKKKDELEYPSLF